jgi:hypothetical protein
VSGDEFTYAPVEYLAPTTPKVGDRWIDQNNGGVWICSGVAPDGCSTDGCSTWKPANPTAVHVTSTVPTDPRDGDEWNGWIFTKASGWRLKVMDEPAPAASKISVACSCGKRLDERDTTKDGAITCYWCGAKHRVRR